MTPTQLAVRRWAGVTFALVFVCPVAAVLAAFVGLAVPTIAGLPGLVITQCAVVLLAGAAIWRWRPAERDRAIRIYVLIAVCLALAIGGAFSVDIYLIFSDPVWDDF